jgi:anaerobic selenocysteine-containing dehydrogenase
MGAPDRSGLTDVESLRTLNAKELRDLAGRLPYPMVRRRGEPGFRRVSCDDALDLVADRLRAAAPDRMGI